MATVDDYFASRQCVWDDFGGSGNISVMVSEILQSRNAESIHRTLTHTISNESLPKWLSSTQGHTNQKGDICLLRIVWFPYDRRQGKVDAGHGVLPAVTQAFNHQLAQSRLRATFAGVSSVTEPLNGKKAYWFCNHPHLAVTWSRDPESQIINVIFIAQPSKITMLQDLVTCRFAQELASADTFPTLLCMLLLCREIDNLLIDVKNQVRQAEVRTGHHRFANRFEMPASGDLVQLSAAMSGCMSNLAVLTRRLGVLTMMRKWTDDLAVEDATNLASTTAVLSTVQQHSSMQQLDIDFFVRRTQIQQDAMLHLIGEQGNLTSRDIAKDSHSLAMLARNDTSVMKGLAFLAAIFVPPAFVSSLLSIPLFDWGSPDESSKDTSLSLGTKILIYISITCPLMLITFSIWGIFLYWERSGRKKRSNTLASFGFQESGGRSETTSLIARRRLS